MYVDSHVSLYICYLYGTYQDVMLCNYMSTTELNYVMLMQLCYVYVIISCYVYVTVAICYSNTNVIMLH